MSTISCNMYYVGHGCMFYIEVTDSMGIIEKKILVDAGTTSDATGNQAAVSRDVVLGRIIASPAPLIICITHLHADHYSYLWDFFCDFQRNARWNLLEHVYIGSTCMDLNFFAEVLQNIYYLAEVGKPGSITFMEKIEAEKSLWVSDERDVKLLVLFNRLPGYGDVNDESAAFLLKHETEKKAIFFTGDITGMTFDAMNKCHYRIENLRYSLAGYEVYMTIPHHGSIHTMEKEYFIIQVSVCPYRVFTTKNMEMIFSELLISRIRLLISSGVEDEHGHPDIFITKFYYSHTIPSMVVNEHFPGCKTYSNTGYPLPTKGVIYMAGKWYAFLSKRLVYTTVTADITNGRQNYRNEQINIP